MIREHRANKSLTRDTLASQAGSSDRPVERAESPATGSPANLRQRPFRLNQTLGATETQMGVHDLNRASIRLNFGPERNAWFTAIPRAFPGSSAARIRRSGSGNRWPDWTGNTYFGDVVDAGVRIFLYEKGYLHAKTISIDSKICSIGSANIDIRSFSINYEMNAVLYDERLAQQLEQDFARDLADCTDFDEKEYERRNVAVRFRDSLARLVSPLL
jgi:hypothetical protein